MGEPTSRQATRPHQQRKTVRFACDETEVDDRSPSLGPFLAFDIPTTSRTTKPQEPENAVGPSLQMVPYVPRGFGKASTAMVENHDKHPLFNLLSNEHHNHKLLRASSVPRHALVSEAGPSRGVESGGPELELGSVSPPWHARVPPRALSKIGKKWIVVPAEQFKQQAENAKALEDKVKSHKRERVLIYDAAMKQAKKKEEEDVNEVKHKFEREQGNMRREVDLELSKISDLYQERCRDYATMVADECEGEVTKEAAELREDWVRQKKTIEQIVRSDGEDRQVSVIARAVMEQLQEERKDEIDALRAEIYSEVKTEFESREVALREALQSDFQADLDGQLLLAEIRHQKEIDALRLELGGGKAPSAEAAAGTIVVYKAESPRCQEGSEGASGASSSARSPSLSRRPLQRRVGSGAGGNLARKFPVFKTPVQRASPDVGDKNARSRPAANNKPSVRTKRVSRTPVATGEDDPKSTPVRKQESQPDGDLTSQLMVSPTKVVGVVTPIDSNVRRSDRNSKDGTQTYPGDGESPRPKKRAKRLFPTTCP